jgi:hypothetical protein
MAADFDGVVMSVSVSGRTFCIKLTHDDLGIEKGTIIPEMNLGNILLLPKKRLDQLSACEARARNVLASNSFPLPGGRATFFVPNDRFLKAVRELQVAADDQKVLVENLIRDYEVLKAEMIPQYEKAAYSAYLRKTPEETTFGLDRDIEKEKTDYIQQFVSRITSYYPTEGSIREAFQVSWTLLPVKNPFKGEDSEILEQIAKNEAEKAELRRIQEEANEMRQAALGDFLNESVALLRAQTTELASHVLQSIKDGKVLRTQTFESLTNHIEKFKSMNFIGDATVEAQLDALKSEVLDKYTVKEMADSGEGLTSLKRKLTEIISCTADVSDLPSITGGYRRKMVM